MHVFVKRNWQKKAVYKSQQQAPFIDPTQLGQACPPNRGLSSQNSIPKNLEKFCALLDNVGLIAKKYLCNVKITFKANSTSKERKCGPFIIIICIKADLQKA